MPVTTQSEIINQVVHGNCIDILSQLPSASIDMILTDPPYIAKYVSRTGQQIANDDRSDWLQPAFSQIFRVLNATPSASAFTAGITWTSSCRHGGTPGFVLSAIWCFRSATHPISALLPIPTNRRTYWQKAIRVYRNPRSATCNSGSTLATSSILRKNLLQIWCR